MEGKLPRSNTRPKRPFLEDFEDNEPSNSKRQKKVRFPKGKKVKPGDESVDWGKAEDAPSEKKDPHLAAKERAKRRSQITTEHFNEETNDISVAEVTYEDDENFIEDGVQMEPFNLNKEREEGFFDAEGNFVEYINGNEIKDAWLDSVEVNSRHAGKSSVKGTNEDDTENDVHDLSSEDIGIIKRRIANLLEPGETVLQALRRLKGNSSKSKEKMSAETQLLFDCLTEDANRLLDNGDYNVYHDQQEVFEREAEGYERLAQARGKCASISAGQEASNYMGKDLFSDVTDIGAASSALPNTDVGASNQNVSTAQISSNGADAYDMFADYDDGANAKPSADHSVNGVGQMSSAGSSESDYIYDETSGFYYSSSLGYYYDPCTGLYCHATSGKWYAFNEETGTYDEVHEVASNAN